MSLSKKLFLIPTLLLLLLVSSCSNDDESTGGQNSCLADDFELTETAVNDFEASDTVAITFDVKNNSSVDYNVVNGSEAIYYTVVVTTTDGSTFEMTGPLALALSAGATTSADALGTYGAGRTYESYTISLYCN